jgi:hypothetical protein
MVKFSMSSKCLVIAVREFRRIIEGLTSLTAASILLCAQAMQFKYQLADEHILRQLTTAMYPAMVDLKTIFEYVCI